jgi:glycosyltransferase involved in cell wall biosynthesis
VKRFVFAVPGDLATPTGGYTYDRRMVAELEALGWQVEVADIGNEFPRPSEQALAEARARLLAVRAGTPIVVDGLAFGVLPELAADLHVEHPLIALVHHPLALESGIPADTAARFHRSERAALSFTDGVIVTSPSTARLLARDYGVEPDDITVAPPGTEPRVAASRGRNPPLALLAVGTVVRRKGYDVLVAALARMRDLPWRATIVGDCTRSPETVTAIEAEIRHHDLAGRIELTGAVDDKRLAELHANADLFVLPSRFEGYGMAFAEAIAHGLPVIGTTAGAIPDTVPDGAGVLVPPDDADALAQALRHLMTDFSARETLAAAARAAAARLPTWRQSAEAFARAIEAVG